MAKTKGADTSLMVGGKSVPVNQGVADPPPEKLTNKEVLETLDDHERRLDALEEIVLDGLGTGEGTDKSETKE